MPTKILLRLTAIVIILTGCSEGAVEEFTFRKLAEHDLKEECGQDKSCRSAISSQIKHCMEFANWRVLLEKEEDDKAFFEFNEVFRPCFKDENGNVLL